MANESTLSSTNRKEFIDEAVKATALLAFRLRELCTIDRSDAWTNTYYQRTNTQDTVAALVGSSFSGVPQMAPFPAIEQPLVKVSALTVKYAAESVLPLETIQMATVPMLREVVLTVSRRIAYALDAGIEAVMNASAGNAVAISAGNEWDSATVANRDPIKDILSAINKLREDGIDALNGNGFLVLNGTDYTNLISNTKVTNNPSFKTADVVSNGKVGQICGLTIMLSETVTADQCYVVVAQEALTLKLVEDLTTAIIEDPGKSSTIRGWLQAAIQIPVPNAVCEITNTRA